MSDVRFLFDNHVTPDIRDAVHRHYPEAYIRVVGVDAGVPPAETPDPELLAYATDNDFAIVTFDASTMPMHAYARIDHGIPTCGVFVFTNSQRMSVGEIGWYVSLIWAASVAEEWLNWVEHLPY